MSKQPVLVKKEKTPTEAAGYIAGTLTGAAEMVMPIRMWITLIACVTLIIFVFQSESLLKIAAAFSVFVSLISVLIGSAVYGKKTR